MFILQGMFTGCEIAYELALQGKEPVIVELQDDLVKVPGVCAANSSMLRDLMRYHKVPVYLEAKTKEIREGSVLLETKDGDKEIDPGRDPFMAAIISDKMRGCCRLCNSPFV